jgi:predicted aldo/keto reductase-like oxidoreductase
MKSNTSNRREFIKNSSLGILGAALIDTKKVSDNLAPHDPDSPSIKAFRKLGRTGFNISDIGCGPAVISHEKVLKAILDAGVNYIDSAIAYGEKNEIMIGNVIKDYDRESLFISSKYRLKDDTTKEDVITQIRAVLERMKTDYLDCLQMHMVSSSKELKNEAFHEATEQLKREGRLKFIGVSCHGSNWFQDPEESMEDILSNAIEDGRFDVLLLVYNFVQQEMGKRILEKCRKNNLGTTLMKTDPFGGYNLSLMDQYEQLKNEGKEIPGYLEHIHNKILVQRKMAKSFIEEHKLEDNDAINRAAIRFVLSNEDAHSTLITFRNYNDINKYIDLSGTKLTDQEVVLLDHYRNFLGRYYCRHACGLCESSCPAKIPINTIMRYNHYFMAQDRQKYAIEKFYGLPGRSLDKCRNCKGFCEKNCPYGVSIRDLLSVAEQNLTIRI